MVEHRVGELSLKVRTDADAPEFVRRAAEDFVRASIERCAALLEARHPGRVVLLERLPLRLALDETRLDDETKIEATARASAAAIEAGAVLARVDLSDADGPVVFDDEAQWRASHLLARARGRAAWFHAALAEEAADPWAVLLAPERRTLAAAVLRRLAEAGVLAEVLAVQAPLAVAVLAAAWECDVLADANAHLGTVDADMVRELAATAAAWPALGAVAWRLALHAHAAVRLEARTLRDEPVRLLAAAAAASADAPLEGAGPRPPVSASPVAPENVDEAHEATPASDATLPSDLAGLVPLLILMQELGVAEALWEACLPEGLVVVDALRTLVDEEHAGDALFALLGGSPATVMPQVGAEQFAEVAATICASLCAALPRRGLAEMPDATVCCVDHSGGRLLVATAEGSPFVFFAWPAPTPDALRAGLETLLQSWSRTALLFASPALARLDSTGRLRARPETADDVPALPRVSSAFLSALLAVVAGAPATLFAARLDALDGDDREAFARRWFLRRARLDSAGEGLVVRLDEDERDLALRRAGLDRDPGWVEWLSRKLGFEFTPRPVRPDAAAGEGAGDGE